MARTGGGDRERRTLVAPAVMALAGSALLFTGAEAAAQAAAETPTFARDVAPIFQAKCQVCHRPESMAPMSLLTYAESRPWARSIRNRVALREMPPWHLDPTVGIQRYKNDLSLTDEQIDTIVRWVDGGAPRGDPADLPPPVEWPAEESWEIGTPDWIVTSPEHTMYAEGTDWWPNFTVDSGLTEDRYIKAIETKPSPAGRRVVHHAVTSLVQDEQTDMGYLSEYAPGKYGDIFADDTGRLIEAGSQVRFNMHYFAIGEEVTDRTSVGMVFYPRGVVPKYAAVEINVGTDPGGLYRELDIPPHSVTRHDGYYTLPRAARLISYQPHMHMRGRAMTMEAIYPSGETETLSAVDRFDFNWHVAYVYEDDVAPLLPAGTVLHTIGIHDNTAANRLNPDPTVWVGTGNRSIDDMLQNHVILVYLEDEDYERMVAERRAQLGFANDNQ